MIDPAKTAKDRILYAQVPYGYWTSQEDHHPSPYPWPYITGVPDQDFLDALCAVEVAIRTTGRWCGVSKCMGHSTSRLTGERLGYEEFFVADDDRETLHLWPVDYGPHYLAAGVAPDPAFVQLITRVHAQLGLSEIRRDPAP